MKSMKVKMTAEAMQRAENLCTQSLIDKLGYLCGRWQDEKEYEDWADYDKAIRGYPELKSLKILKTTSRPVGVTVDIDGFAVRVYALASGMAGWKRVAA